MRKTVIKDIRKFCETLPEMWYKKKVKIKVRGNQLKLEGKTEVQGEAISDGKMYFKEYLANVKIDHVAKCKDLYKKHGLEGIKAYLKDINTLAAKLNQDEIDAKKLPAESGVSEIDDQDSSLLQ